MKKKSGAFALAILVVIVVLGSLLSRSFRGEDKSDTVVSAGTDAAMIEGAKKTSTEQIAAGSNTKEAAVANAISGTSNEPKKERSPRPAPQPVAKLIPPLEKERSEVAKDPHGTPQSITKFSLELGERLDAVNNDDEAASLMDELDQCVTKTERKASTSVKTLCLLNAKKLAKKFPSMDAKFANLEERADSDIRSNVGFFK